MCGIAGIVAFDRPGEAWRDELARMKRRLAHRGPDGHGESFGASVALAHTRLAMMDAQGGAQPFRSEDGRYTLVYNGELYAHERLRSRLLGPWRTRSDTETVLAAWRAWGPACIAQLDGMFAFFVWDEALGVGHAVRDRLGVKPLAYTSDGPFAFASEARALLPFVGRARANGDAIVEHLVAPAFSGVSRSPFAGIQYLPPAHVLRIDRDGVTTQRHWRWSPTEDDGDPERLAQELCDALRDAVHGASRADASLGVFASGGLDSSAIHALTPAPLPAYTITFDGEEAWERAQTSRLVVSSDAPFARMSVEARGGSLTEVRFDRASLAAELRAIARVDDALPAWEQELSQRALARVASQGVKGVLVGDAADETHYGYHFLLDAEATSAPSAIVKRLGSVPVRREVDPDPLARLDAEYRAIGGEGSPVARTTRLIVERWLPRLLHDGDVQCMAFGLEARVPFASSAVLDVAQRIAPRLALVDGVEKSVLRRALRGVVPEPIRTRRKSALPKDQAVDPIYRAEAREVIDAPHEVVRTYVDLEAVRRVIDAPRVLDEAQRAQLFRVIVLHHWAEAHEVRA